MSDVRPALPFSERKRSHLFSLLRGCACWAWLGAGRPPRLQPLGGPSPPGGRGLAPASWRVLGAGAGALSWGLPAWKSPAACAEWSGACRHAGGTPAGVCCAPHPTPSTPAPHLAPLPQAPRLARYATPTLLGRLATAAALLPPWRSPCFGPPACPCYPTAPGYSVRAGRLSAAERQLLPAWLPARLPAAVGRAWLASSRCWRRDRALSTRAPARWGPPRAAWRVSALARCAVLRCTVIQCAAPLCSFVRRAHAPAVLAPAPALGLARSHGALLSSSARPALRPGRALRV